MLRYEPVENGLTIPPASPAQIAERLQPYRNIVEHRQHAKISWRGRDGKKHSMSCDSFTASAVVAVAGKLSPENLAKLATFEPPMLVDLVWKTIRK